MHLGGHGIELHAGATAISATATTRSHDDLRDRLDCIRLDFDMIRAARDGTAGYCTIVYKIEAELASS